MSEVIDQAIAALNAKLADAQFDGAIKFVIKGEGSVRVDETGASANDDDADCTLTASAETFRALLDGDMGAAAAFMTGKLAVDGDMAMAMKLGGLFA